MMEVQPAVLTEKLSEKELCPDELLGGQESAFARDIERLKARRAEFVAVPCPACGSIVATPTLVKFTFQYVTCGDCQTLYMSPRPSEAVMGDYYRDSENYRYWAKYIFPSSEASRREKIHKPWLERVTGFCERFGISSGVLMEVGPGFGTFSALATESGRFSRVVAVECTPELAAACRARGVEVVEKRIEDVGDEVPAADVVVSFECIEHLFAPRVFLESCARRLRPGGLLVLSCPNGQGFDVAMLGAESLAIDAEHVNLFNPSSLSRLVEACGFEVLEVSTPGRLDEWERLGWPFQQFLAENGLSSHMWMAARRRGGA
jgi:2-polyprenyl-3-methyl-5-hydroxy-6-metoxy-1,4-benzoquinol methylase